MRNRLHEESQTRSNQVRHLKIDVLSMQQDRNPTTVNQPLTQIQEVQNQVNSMSDAREFHDPKIASSSGTRHFPSQPLTIPSSRGMPIRHSGLPLLHGILSVLQETFLKAHFFEKEHSQHSSKIRGSWHHLVAD